MTRPRVIRPAPRSGFQTGDGGGTVASGACWFKPPTFSRFVRLRMADETNTGIAAHGASRLPWVEIDSFNLELKDEEEFVGDRASKGAFRETLEKWRKPLRKSGEDPFGKELSEDVSKKELDAALGGDDPEASVVVHSAVEDFAQELARVTRQFLKTKAWDKTERIVMGGGFRDSRLGELAIARAEILLKADNFKLEMLPIHSHPDDAGLIGALYLAPSWIFEAHDSILAVDIGGTNIRCGVVETRRKKGAGPLQGLRVEVRTMASCRRRAVP